MSSAPWTMRASAGVAFCALSTTSSPRPQRSPLNSRAKGKRGELEWAAWLREHGYADARRGRQYAGHEDAPDVRCDSLPYHVEVKRVEALNLYAAWEKACADCGDKAPIIAHRRNRTDWLVTLSAAEFFRLLKAA